MISLPSDFIVGANLPWVDYGIDFGANAWRPEGGIGNHLQRLDDEVSRLAASGVTAIRWFLFCDGRAGIRFDPSGKPLGLDDYVLRDMMAAIDTACRHGVRVMPVLLDFLWCHDATTCAGVQQGGRAAVLRDTALRTDLLDRVFRPVLEQFASDPTIIAWDLMNEPEWITRGLAARRRRGFVDGDQLHQFFEDALALVHEVATQPVTVGSAGAIWREFYRDLGLDFYQVHWYPTLRKAPVLETPVDALGFDKPVVLGEFPTRGARPAELLDIAKEAGYAGAFYWSALANDACSDPTYAVKSSR